MFGLDLLGLLKIASSRYLNKQNIATLNLLANVIESRDPYTAGHTWRVAKYATAMARRLGWSSKRVVGIEIGSFLHDLGKISTEDRVLKKAGKLTAEEYEQIKAHPAEGKRLLQGIAFLQPAVQGIYSHHEHYDGSGYPEGLQGEAISKEGRLMAVADVFDALTSNRSYRRPISAEEGLSYLQGQKGTLFDPKLVDLFTSIWDEGKLEKTVLHSEGHIPLLSCPHDGPTIAVQSGSSEGDSIFCPVCKTRFVLVNRNGDWQPQLTH
ncbi:MAG: HD-GYP domain-containing protein [Nitrospiria bacterium]